MFETDTINRQAMIHVAVAAFTVSSCESLIQPLEINGREQVRHPDLTCLSQFTFVCQRASINIYLKLILEKPSMVFP